MTEQKRVEQSELRTEQLELMKIGILIHQHDRKLANKIIATESFGRAAQLLNFPSIMPIMKTREFLAERFKAKKWAWFRRK